MVLAKQPVLGGREGKDLNHIARLMARGQALYMRFWVSLPIVTSILPKSNHGRPALDLGMYIFFFDIEGSLEEDKVQCGGKCYSSQMPVV